MQIARATAPSDVAPAESSRRSLRPWLAAALLAVALGAAFQGGRGVWDPSEGFYTNAAVGMAESGDWWTPRLNGEPFLDKPPVVYWSIATGLKLLGVNEWGARLTLIFWYAATALLVGVLAQSFWGGSFGPLATAVYALSFLPFLAANTLTTDPLLAFWTTATMYLFWRMDRASRAPASNLWAVALGAAIGLGLLTKGPAMLVFLPPLAVYLALRRKLLPALRIPGLWLGVAVALLLGGSWYVSMVTSLPGALDFVLDNQVSGRMVSAKYGRNPGVAGLFRVYVPTLVLGALPWAVLWPKWIAGSRERWRRFRWWRGLAQRPTALLVVLWFVLPMTVLATASSKLPLYLLPLAAPLALVAARMLGGASGATPPRRAGIVWVALWIAFLLAVKFVSTQWPSHQDTRATARALEGHEIPSSTQLFAVNRAENGLALYGYGKLSQVATGGHEIYFSPIRSLQEAIEALEPDSPTVFIGAAKDLELAGSLIIGGPERCQMLAGGNPKEFFLNCLAP